MKIRTNLVRQSWTLVALTACALNCGCTPGGPITITTAYGSGMKFNGLGSKYSWAPETGERQGGSPGFQNLVHEIVERNLAAKDFQLNPTAPDFWIDYRVAKREKTDASVVASGLTVEEGSLVLEVISASNREYIWWGIAKAQISDSDTPDLRKQRLEAAVKQLMTKFPAKM
jgi:hypothetical protein